MRQVRELLRLRDKMEARSEMADALVGILDLWAGVLPPESEEKELENIERTNGERAEERGREGNGQEKKPAESSRLRPSPLSSSSSSSSSFLPSEKEKEVNNASPASSLNYPGPGVLLMDEVDVLLHPLKSELNFPIGFKSPIDLSGYRWDLPIHLFEAVFFQQTGEQTPSESVSASSHALHFSIADGFSSETEREKGEVNKGKGAGGMARETELSPSNSSASPSLCSLKVELGKKTSPRELLEKLSRVILEGYKVHAVMGEPHLVVLDR